MYHDFDTVRSDALARIGRGASDRHSPMHTPVVATADADARVMVLRDFDPATWVMRFHTDARAPKCATITADPRVGILAYDKEAKVQLRLRGKGRIETDTPAAEAAWSESTRFARRCYLGEGPGAVSDKPTSGLPERFEGVEPDDQELLPARENFAILLVEVLEIDWFYLSSEGHRRALLTPGDARWISP